MKEKTEEVGMRSKALTALADTELRELCNICNIMLGAMVNTGPAGLALLIYFTLNGAFVGTRLGLCWLMVEERFPEYKGKCRDPYPTIAEKAFGKVGPTIPHQVFKKSPFIFILLI